MASISKEELETIAAILVNRAPEETERIRAEELKTTVANIRNQERNEGYYSVNEAVALLLAETGEYFRIGKATWDGDLESYAPNSGKKIVTKGNIPSDWTHYDEAAEVRWDNLNAWLEKHTRVQYRFPNPSAASETPAVPVVTASDAKPWLQADSRDPVPAQPWYTPARYFARQLVIKNCTLLAKRETLATQVSTELFNAGFKKRGGKLKFDSGTVLKAFANVTLG